MDSTRMMEYKEIHTPLKLLALNKQETRARNKFYKLKIIPTSIIHIQTKEKQGNKNDRNAYLASYKEEG